MICSICTSCHIVTFPANAGSVAGLLAGGEKLPTDRLPGAKKRKVTPKKGLQPGELLESIESLLCMISSDLFRHRQRWHVCAPATWLQDRQQSELMGHGN